MKTIENMPEALEALEKAEGSIEKLLELCGDDQRFSHEEGGTLSEKWMMLTIATSLQTIRTALTQ